MDLRNVTQSSASPLLHPARSNTRFNQDRYKHLGVLRQVKSLILLSMRGSQSTLWGVAKPPYRVRDRVTNQVRLPRVCSDTIHMHNACYTRSSEINQFTPIVLFLPVLTCLAGHTGLPLIDHVSFMLITLICTLEPVLRFGGCSVGLLRISIWHDCLLEVEQWLSLEPDCLPPQQPSSNPL